MSHTARGWLTQIYRWVVIGAIAVFGFLAQKGFQILDEMHTDLIILRSNNVPVKLLELDKRLTSVEGIIKGIDRRMQKIEDTPQK